MTRVRACVGLGGNVGEVAQTLLPAIAALDALPRTRPLQASRLHRTPAWGRRDQPDFLNAAAVLDPGVGARALLAELLALEQRFGRERGAGDERWGPRGLALD